MPAALDDLRQIEEYIGQENPRAAVKFVDQLTERFQQLAQFPNIGHKCDEIKENYRSIAEGEYIIFFRKLDDVRMAIMRVVHGKRDLAELDFP